MTTWVLAPKMRLSYDVSCGEIMNYFPPPTADML